MDVVERHLLYLYLLGCLLQASTPNPNYPCDCRDRPHSITQIVDGTKVYVPTGSSVDHCLHDLIVPFLYERDERDIQKYWGMEIDEIDALKVRSNPSEIKWLLSAHHLSRKFDIHRVPGFYYWHGLWRVNISQDIHFLVPYRNADRLIIGIKLYRYAAEEQPALLQSAGLPYGARAEMPFESNQFGIETRLRRA